MSATPLTVTNTAPVTADQIDELGHMNVRWYGHRARAATVELCQQLGIGSPTILSAYTRHHHEQLEGSELEVRSGVLGGTTRLRMFHELRNTADNDLAATFIYDLDHPAVEAPVIEVPDYGAPRTINLDLDRFATAPSLGELQAHELEARLERKVSADDVHPNDLFWNGERPDGEQSWIHETADGDRVASAVMESRFWMREFPAQGTRIQSFMCNIGLGEKTTHELGWVFDLESCEPVAVFEGLDLSFSLKQRRSIAKPASVHARDEQRFHPHFG